MKKIFSLLALTLLTLVSAQAQSSQRIKARGLATSRNSGFQIVDFTRHPVGDRDVQIEILYASICHSDFMAKQMNEPLVPGHEMVGRVVKVGKEVKRFKVGDYAGVGCMVNSCGECAQCKAGFENHCEKTPIFTYGFPDSHHHGEITQGGYSDNIVVDEHFVLSLPKGTDLRRAAPLLCAGITTWSPIHFSQVKQGDVVGVAGFGGLGHMALQYLVDLGAQVTVFDLSEDKRADASRLGAVRYVNVNNPAEFQDLNNSYDFILSTIPNDYDPMQYVRLLKLGKGELAIVGIPRNSGVSIASLVMEGANRKIYSSFIGGIRETQEMINYSVAKGIYPIVEVIKAEPAELDKAYERIDAGLVKFRYVIDMKTLKKN